MKREIYSRTLVSKGAASFARSQNIKMVSPDELVSERARDEWVRWKAKLEAARTAAALESLETPDNVDKCEGTSRGVLEDTVGAVCCNDLGEMAAGVSRWVPLCLFLIGP